MELSDDELLSIFNKRKDIIDSVNKAETVIEKFSDISKIFVSITLFLEIYEKLSLKLSFKLWINL